MLSSDDVKYGGTGVELAPVKARKEEQHGLPYCVELTLPPMSAVFYEHKAVRSAARAGKAAEDTDAAGEAPKTTRKPRAKKTADAGEAPKPARRPRAKKTADAGEAPKPARKSRAKKSESEN